MSRDFSLSRIYALVCNCIVAVLVCLKLLNQTMFYQFKASEGFFSVIMLYAYLTFAFGSFLIIFVSDKKVPMKAYMLVALALLILGFWYFASLDVTKTNTWQLAAFVLLPTIIASVTRFQAKTILTAILLIAYFCIPALELILVVDWRGSIDMDVSYALLPPIVAGIIHFSFFRSEHKRYYLLYVPPVFYLIKLLTYGVRGPVLCILVTLLLTILLKPGRSKRKRNQVIFLTSLLVIVALFYESILLWLHDVLSQYGIQFYFVDKFITLINENELAHGRGSLIGMAFDGFLNSPIAGNGLNSFEHFTGEIYPHNFLAQLLFEGGLLMFGLFLVPVFIASKRIYNTSDENSKITFVLLFSISVPYFMVSASMWSSPLLWLFLGYCINVASVPTTSKKRLSRVWLQA